MSNMKSPIDNSNNIKATFNIPESNYTYQIPYKAPYVEIPFYIPNSNFEGDMLVSHIFTSTDLINPNYIFDDTTARDAYFTAHPTELIDGIYILIGVYWYDYYTYASSTWEEVDPFDAIIDLLPVYYSSHPEELEENMVVMVDNGYFRYIDSTWINYEYYTEVIGGWIPLSYGFQFQSIEMTSDNCHSGSQCIKVVHTSNGGSDWYGGGVCQYGIDFTNIYKITCWARGEDDAIGASIKLLGPTMSNAFILTDEWQQFSFDVSPYHRLPNREIEIAVGDSYSSYGSIYTVYIDDVQVYTKSENEISWITDIDSYIETTINTTLSTPIYAETPYLLQRAIQINPIPNGNMEGDILSLWYGPGEGETISISTNIVHSETQSLKISFHKGSGTAFIPVSIDHIDLSEYSTIEFYVYGNENSTNTSLTINESIYVNIIPGTWTLCSLEILPEFKTSDQTFYIKFLDYESGERDIEIYIDDIVALKTENDKYEWIDSTQFPTLPETWESNSLLQSTSNEGEFNWIESTQFPTTTVGTSAPSHTPTKVSDFYVDTNAGIGYMAVGTSSSADWKQITNT